MMWMKKGITHFCIFYFIRYLKIRNSIIDIYTVNIVNHLDISFCRRNLPYDSSLMMEFIGFCN